MAEIAVIFPGQGSQYVGMAEDLCNKYAEAREILNIADNTLGYKISEIMFRGPEEVLKSTVFTQPALLTASTICWRLMQTEGVPTPSFAAGHSLGEYSALVASESLSFEDALKLVSKRGKLMEEAVPSGQGSMAAILGMSFEQVEDVCLRVNGVVEAVNYNCPGQVVIAGIRERVEEASALALKLGAKKAIQLNVSGPFHSNLMKPAAAKYANELEKITIKKPKFPVVANLTAEVADAPQVIMNNLKMQIYNPVLWDMSMRRIIDAGISTFIEVGPSNVLAYLMKKIDKNIKVFNVGNVETLENTLKVIKEVS
ncbi:MAG: ACP S-malonyltransferase [Bacillota bacterium]